LPQLAPEVFFFATVSHTTVFTPTPFETLKSAGALPVYMSLAAACAINVLRHSLAYDYPPATWIVRKKT